MPSSRRHTICNGYISVCITYVLCRLCVIRLLYRIRSQFVCGAGYICLQSVRCTGYNVEYQDIRRRDEGIPPYRLCTDRGDENDTVTDMTGIFNLPAHFSPQQKNSLHFCKLFFRQNYLLFLISYFLLLKSPSPPGSRGVFCRLRGCCGCIPHCISGRFLSGM